MGNTTEVMNDYASKAQEAAVKTAQTTTQAVSSVGRNVATMASSAINASYSGTMATVSKVVETDMTLENKIIVDIAELHDCKLCLCKTELKKGNGVVYNALGYVMSIKENVNQIIESQVNPVIETNIKLIFQSLSDQINIYNKQKDGVLIAQIKKYATDTYGFDSQRHAPIVTALREIVAKLLDFKNVQCKFKNEWFESTLKNENEFNAFVRKLRFLLDSQNIDYQKIASWHYEHYFPMYYNNSPIYINISVGFQYKYIKIQIYKNRLFNIVEREMENIIDQNWDQWIEQIKTQNQKLSNMNIKLRNSNISLSVNPQSSSKINFNNTISLRISK